MEQFEDLLRTIRTDLGYDDKGLEDGDLLRPFRKGVDEYVEERRKVREQRDY